MEELKGLIEAQGQAFAEFKALNDERLKAIEAKGYAPADVVEKVGRANDAIDELQKQMDELAKKSNRPGEPGGAGSGEDAQYKSAFVDWVRKGDAGGVDRKSPLKSYEAKAGLNTVSPEDGGIAAPPEMSRRVLALLRTASPMRSVSNVVTIGSSGYEQPVSLGGSTYEWVGELDSVGETSTPKLAMVSPQMGKITAYVKATEESLDDSFFDIESWLLGDIALGFAEGEGNAFTVGNGVKKPKGFLAYPTSSDVDGTRDFGTFQYVATGVSGGFAASEPQDILTNLEYALKAPYRAGAVYMMPTSVLKTIRQWKNADGDYIWQPSLQAGEPNRINGYPFVVNEDMPTVSAGSLSLAFGNFKRGFTIVDRIGLRVTRNPFKEPNYVWFYARKRVGSMATDTQAIKLAKFAAS